MASKEENKEKINIFCKKIKKKNYKKTDLKKKSKIEVKKTLIKH